MKKKIIIALALFFCFNAKITQAQLFKVSKLGIEQQIFFGYINSTGKVIVPATYNTALDFSDSLGGVFNKDWKLGYINSLGKLVIPCKYEDGYSFQNGYALVEKDEKGLVIDKKGKEYKISNLFLSEFNCVSDGLVIVTNGGKKGYANLKDEIIIPIEFDEALIFSEGHAIAMKNNSLYLLDAKGNMKEMEYVNAGNMTNGLIPVENKEGKWGVINSNLEVIVDFKYDFIAQFSDGYAQFQQGDVGLMNTKGEHVLEPIYATLNRYSENRVLAQSTFTTATLFDENFKVVKEFSNVHYVSNGDLCFKNGLCPLYFELGPTASSKDENVQKYGGISLQYINPKGEIVWKGEPHYACFPEGSKVKMADFSEKNIQNIRAGDEIMTFNEKTNQYEKTNVIQLEKHEGNFQLIEITVNSKSNLTASVSDKMILANTKMTATPNHPILTKAGVKLMSDISENDVLILWSDEIQAFEELTVSSVSHKESTKTVYNLKTVAKNYLVNSVVVMMK